MQTSWRGLDHDLLLDWLQVSALIMCTVLRCSLNLKRSTESIFRKDCGDSLATDKGRE